MYAVGAVPAQQRQYCAHPTGLFSATVGMDSHGNAAQYGEGFDLGLFVYCWVMGIFTKDERIAGRV